MWRSAADDDLVDYPNDRRIRKLKVEHAPTECFSLDEARALVATAESMRGYIWNTDVFKRDYWPALLRFAWDTGLRRGDCFRFDKSILKPDGTFRVVQSKTKRPLRRKLQPDTIMALANLSGQQPLKYPGSEYSFAENFKKLTLAAGIDRGCFKWLRRACGSHVEAEHPGAGHKALGNTAQVFRQHYDADMATEILMPPKL